jgi:hypothetical protein
VKQLGLQRDGHLGNFVEIERALIGVLELPRLPAMRAGEGAALVAEELGLEELRRDGGAIDLHERPRLAPRSRVQCARAMRSLPTPLSPRINTVASVSATLSTIFPTACMEGLPSNKGAALPFKRVASCNRAVMVVLTARRAIIPGRLMRGSPGEHNRGIPGAARR